MVDAALREQLIEFLDGKGAHASTLDALADFPASMYATRPAGSPHNAWQLLEHIRITLNDLLDFCSNKTYQAPKWPDAYWPSQDTPPAPQAWGQSLDALRRDLQAFQALLRDPGTDLHSKIPWGDGQTVLHEALLAIDHTSYHIGQFVLLRKQLSAWNG
ncbi:MAG TPA: DinB family protein [Acidobacteriaceae bacterium]|nr:DinB family protein [Acidobacteriaceae bacterium]